MCIGHCCNIVADDAQVAVCCIKLQKLFTREQPDRIGLHGFKSGDDHPLTLELQMLDRRAGDDFPHDEILKNIEELTLSFAYPLDRHQANGFQRAMIKAATVSRHDLMMTRDTVEYKENVALIPDW